MTKTNLSIAIVGCGIGGLAAACFLERCGHHVRLFERFEHPKPIGAGLMLQPTGLACLANLGIDKAVIDTSAKIFRLDGRTHNNRIVFDLDYRLLSAHYFGLGTHRSVIFNLLYNKVLSHKITITSHCEIIDSHLKGARRTLIDANHNEYGAYDLVIDASGRRSNLRNKLGDVKYNKEYPFAAVWGLLNDPGQKFGQDILQQRFYRTQVMVGALPVGKRLGESTEQIAFFWSLPLSQYKHWRHQDISIWHKKVTHYWPEIAPLINQFHSTEDLSLAVYNDVVMKRCYGERLLFIGDAAHATSPQLGQGANLALMDAFLFSKILDHNKRLDSSLEQFQKNRRNQIKFYQTASRWLTPFFQSESPYLATIRDLSFGRMCKTPFLNKEMMRTLAGVKSSLFKQFDPGSIHSKYQNV